MNIFKMSFNGYRQKDIDENSDRNLQDKEKKAELLHISNFTELDSREAKNLDLEIQEKQDIQSIDLEATAYLELLYREKKLGKHRFWQRVTEVKNEILSNNTYWQTYEELAYGCKVAWRNNGRCIARLFWQELIVRDLRHLSTAEEIFNACVEHIQIATNKGKIRSVISIFAPQIAGKAGIRIINPFLIRYAGYRQANGEVIGDAGSTEFTEYVESLGWKKEKKTHFDLLPLVIKIPGEKPQIFEIPPEVIMEVPIEHPEYDWFAELGLKWYVLPIVADKILSIGGVSYTAAPFSGWYMSSEIASRNFADVDRYNVLPKVAQRMGLNTRSNISLWKDRALVELNIAVLHSFTKHGVTIVDHHTASRQFMKHIEKEQQQGRKVFADWGWIVPPISSSTTEVFHKKFDNVWLKPNFFDRDKPRSSQKSRNGCPFHS
ncbi:MAG: nitric oxide synthase oxygenase [Prochloraceae cyanobacterium]